MSENSLNYFCPLDPAGPAPAYKQLEEQIRNFIEEHPDNTFFPSERQLAQALGVHRATVRKAVGQFLENGQLRRSLKSTVVHKPDNIGRELPKYLPYLDFHQQSQAREAVFAVPEYSFPLWRAIAADFSREHRPVRVVSRKTGDNPFSCSYDEPVDFQLLVNNPAAFGQMSCTYHFIDLTEMFKDLPQNEFYPQVFVRDPGNRIWGIAPNLSLPMFARHRRYFDEPVDHWDFTQWHDTVNRLRRKHSAMPWIFELMGYNHFLFNNGARFIDPADGSLRIDADELSAPLHMLRELALNRSMQIVTDASFDRLKSFAAGDMILIEYSPKIVVDYFMNRPDSDIDFIPCPNRGQYLCTSEILTINAVSLNQETARQFILYVLQPEVQRQIANTVHLFPVRRRVVPENLPPSAVRNFTALADQAVYDMGHYRLDNLFYCMLDAAFNRWFIHGGSYSGMIRELQKNAEFYLENRKNKT